MWVVMGRGLVWVVTGRFSEGGDEEVQCGW